MARGLAVTVDTEVLHVSAAPTEVPDDVDLVVAGGPTHAFSMSRSSTRADAVRQGASLATFGTRVGTVRHLPGSAAASAARSGRRHGFRLAASSSVRRPWDRQLAAV